MIYTWEPEDIEVGKYYHRGTLEWNKDHSYAKSCFHKIGYASMAGYGVDNCKARYMPKLEGEKGLGQSLFVMISMCDGAVMGPKSAAEMCEYLNKGGYKPTSYDELQLMFKRKET